MPLWALALVVLNIGSCVVSDWRKPRLKRVSKSQQREKKKVQKRQAREDSKDKEELIFPPEKSKSESELFTECSRNGLNFPKKSEN